MKKIEKILKSKHHELIAWAIRFDGTEYCASIIRNEAEYNSEDVKKELEETARELDVERVELYKSRRVRGGIGITYGKPIAVLV